MGTPPSVHDRPQDTVLTPREPAALPDTPTWRRFRVVRDTASGSSTARHPPRTATRGPRGPAAPAAAVGPALACHPAPAPCVTRPPHARAPAASTRAATTRRGAEVQRQARRDGDATRSCGTETPHGRRAAAPLRPRRGRAVGDGWSGPEVPQAEPRRTPRSLPSRGVEESPPRRGEPARAGGAPSRAGYCSHGETDALPGEAGPPGLGSVLLVLPPAP